MVDAATSIHFNRLPTVLQSTAQTGGQYEQQVWSSLGCLEKKKEKEKGKKVSEKKKEKEKELVLGMVFWSCHPAAKLCTAHDWKLTVACCPWPCPWLCLSLSSPWLASKGFEGGYLVIKWCKALGWELIFVLVLVPFP